MKGFIKVMFCLVAVFVLAIALTVGVTKVLRKHQGIERNGYRRFKTVETYEDGCEIVDTDTGWTYFRFYDTGSVVPVFDEYGNTYRANGWRDFG